MSEATERLVRAWSSVVEDTVAATLGACAAMKGGATPRRGPRRSEGTGAGANASACAAAYVGPGKVRVGIGPHPVGAALSASLSQVVPGTALLKHPAQAVQVRATAAGGDTVEIDIGAATPGMYVGRVQDASGAVAVPFVVYVDDVVSQ